MTVAGRSRVALLVALAVDNLGSGLFVPLSLVYLNRVVGLTLGTAGVVLTTGGVLGLAVPAVAGRWADRAGPRAVVVASQLLQAAGLGALLAARSVVLALVGAALVAVGTQAFYSALFGLIADVAPPGPKDRPYAVVAMTRSAAFGAGTLAAGLVLATAGRTGLTALVAVDAATFVVTALLLQLGVHPRAHPSADHPAGGATPVRRNRPFLALIAVTFLVVLGTDVYLIGFPVFALDELGTPAWLPGVCLAVLTAATATLGTLVLRLTRTWTRTATMAAGAVLFAVWCATTVAAPLVPAPARTGWLLGATVVLVAASLLVTSRVNAVAEAAAPPSARGRHLAAFQYAFTVAALVAPLLVALSAVARWLPWVVAAGCSLVAAAALPVVGRRLPAQAVAPERVAAGVGAAGDAGDQPGGANR